MDPLTRLLLTASILLLLAVFASKAAGRFGIPSLLAFLALGIGAGASGGIHLAGTGLARSLGSIALISILFSGGMDTDLEAVRPILRRGLVLATAGVIVSTGLVAAFGILALGLPPLQSVLLGSITSATDVAAVFTVLRGRGVRLKDGLKPLLELEAAVNDPMTVILSVGVLEVLAAPGLSYPRLALFFVRQMGLGTLIGLGSAWLAPRLLHRIELEFEGLYPVLSFALMLLAYAVAQFLGGSGFLAVYVLGIGIGSSAFSRRETLCQFHDGIAWLMQIAMFLVMGLLVLPSELLGVAGHGLALTGFLVLVARPASVLACLAGSRFSWGERLMVSWAGLRGAVPIILATYPLTAGVAGARPIFDLVFFIVFGSVLLQGTTLPAAARILRSDA